MEDRDISIVGFIELKIQLTEIKILVSRCIRNIHHWLTQIDVLYFGQAEAYDIALAKIIRNLYRPNVCFFTLPERINRQPLYFVGWQLFSATWQVAMAHHLKIPHPVFFCVSRVLAQGHTFTVQRINWKSHVGGQQGP
jgi:hypothetical protein